MSDLGVSIQFSMIDRLSGGMRKIESSVGRVSKAFKTTARSAAELDKEMQTVSNRMQNAAFLSLAAGRLEQTASRMRAGVRANVEAIRPLEKALGELRTVDVNDVDLIATRGVQMQKRFAGLTASAYAEAAYDIKSGISSLTDEGVADLTAAAAATAKATKSQVQQMTSLFATGYGIFKRMDAEMTDADWAGKFSSVLAASVKQFKTTGGGMQGAIERSGSGLTLLGSTMEEQLTLLGMLQTSMGDLLAGTSVKMFASTANKAQQAFDEMGYSIDLIDVDGKMMPMVDFLRSLEKEFGKDYNANIGDTIKEAFGSEEPVKMIQNLWGMADAFEANQRQIEKATKSGLGYTYTMAALADKNFDSKLRLFAQQMDAVRISIGKAMQPWLSVILPLVGFFGRLAEAVMKVPILGPLAGGIILGVTLLVSAIAGLATIMAVSYGVFALYGQGQLFLHTNNLTLIGGYKALAVTMLGGMKKAIIWSIGGLYSMATAAWAAVAPFWPIIAVVAAVAGAAFLIVKFWKPIKGFFLSVWDSIQPGLQKLWKLIKTVFGFSPLGMILKNWNPIIKFFTGLWDKIGGILSKIGSMFGLSARAATAGAMVATAAPAAPLPTDQGITPIEQTIAGARMNASSQVNAPITINAPAGQSPEEIARAVSRELNARERQAAASVRGRLYE